MKTLLLQDLKSLVVELSVFKLVYFESSYTFISYSWI